MLFPRGRTCFLQNGGSNSGYFGINDMQTLMQTLHQAILIRHTETLRQVRQINSISTSLPVQDLAPLDRPDYLDETHEDKSLATNVSSLAIFLYWRCVISRTGEEYGPGLEYGRLKPTTLELST